MFNKTDIKHKWRDDPYPAIWEKYIFIAAFGLITAYSDKTLGEIMQTKELVNTTKEIMKEIILIANKKGINLPDDILNKSIDKTNKFLFETKTSYQRDVEKAKEGKGNEGDLFGVTIIRMGKEMGVSTPVTQAILSKIKEKLLTLSEE